MDQKLLEWALTQVRAQQAGAQGRHSIGTLGERTLHAVLKYCWEPDSRFHEIPVEGFVADIARPSGIVEIQTGSLYPLRRKIPALLERAPVTVVHPLAVQRRIFWVDPESGEVDPPRKSSRPQRPGDALPELYWLLEEMAKPGLHFSLPLLAVDEYKLKNGRGEQHKIGASRFERVPAAYLGCLEVDGPEDIPTLLPPLPECFTHAELYRALRLRGRRATAAGKVLLACGAITPTEEKRGRAQLYQKNF